MHSKNQYVFNTQKTTHKKLYISTILMKKNAFYDCIRIVCRTNSIIALQ